MSRKHNFSAGPAIVPLEVMQKAQAELLDFNGCGLSVMEISHRGKEFDAVIKSAESKIRSLMGIGDNYHVLFLQGGASMQFGMIPMNLLQGGRADYVHTGSWADKAIKEARRFGEVNLAASSEDQNFNYIPKKLNLSSDARYLHITTNETIGGIQWHQMPDSSAPLIADMSSDIMSRRIDVSRFGLIYAGAQKNIGISGITLVIIRQDLIDQCAPNLTAMLSYKTHIKEPSLYNTPPTFPIYITNLIMDWIEQLGGLEAMEKRNDEKAAFLYDYIDGSKIYRGTTAREDRSKMNVTFRIQPEELEEVFVKEASQAGMVGLKGHRSVGGCRASIYNAMPIEGVKALVAFMEQFEARNS